MTFDFCQRRSRAHKQERIDPVAAKREVGTLGRGGGAAEARSQAKCYHQGRALLALFGAFYRPRLPGGEHTVIAGRHATARASCSRVMLRELRVF